MRWHWALLVSWVAGCTPGLEAPVEDPEARAKVLRSAEEVKQLQAELDAADPKLREACEFKAGDCLMMLRDKRRELVRGRTFLECEAHGYAEKKARCEEEKLLERGEAESIQEYYDYQSWCLSGMTTCLGEMVEQAKANAHAAMVQARRDAFFGADLARGLETDLRIAEEQLAYIRTTLPPVADGACKDLQDVARCQKEALASTTELEQYLALPEAEYEAAHAEELLKTAKANDIECVDIEKRCVADELENHGATKKTRELLEQNYALLDQRQRLGDQLPPATTQACMQEGQTEHAPYILENYSQYARRRIEYFRIQMHRAFARVHRDQIACLERAGAK